MTPVGIGGEGLGSIFQLSLGRLRQIETCRRVGIHAHVFETILWPLQRRDMHRLETSLLEGERHHGNLGGVSSRDFTESTNGEQPCGGYNRLERK